jgi:hypothetical protein
MRLAERERCPGLAELVVAFFEYGRCDGCAFQGRLAVTGWAGCQGPGKVVHAV